MRRRNALAEFLSDLLAGDPVAWIFVGVVALIAVIILLWGAKILHDKRKLDEERKNRFRKNQSKPL